MTMKRSSLAIYISIAAAVLLLVLANAHLVYVAITSQPDCVTHLKGSGEATGNFRAARSSC